MSATSRASRSTAARLVLGYLLVAVILGGTWLWSLYGPLTAAVLTQQERNITAVAQSAALVYSQSDEAPGSLAEQLVARTDLRLTLVAADGTVLADSLSEPSTMENHADRPEIAEALQGETGIDRRTSATEGNEQIYVAVPGTVGGQRVAVRVSQPVEEIRDIAARSRRVGLALLVVALAASLGLAWPAVRAAARPVAELSKAAETMAEGDLSVRIPDVPTDLEPLASALEDLRSQIRSRIDALESERGTLRAAVDGLSDAVFVLDDDTVELANRQAGEMFSMPPGGWIGAPLDRTSLPASLLAAIRAQRISPDDTGIELAPDPLGRTLRLAVVPLGPGERGARTIVSVGDITERSRLDQVRRDFVANASHELKTPVAGIRLLAESAAAALTDGDREAAATFTAQIGPEVERLQRLVTDLLDLSRLETLPPAGTITDMRSAVERGILSHRAAAVRKGLALDADFSAVEGVDVFAAADPTDVTIALDNLLDNGVAYTATGSVTVRLAADAQSVTLTVTDTGPGIAADQLPRIFERFYRVDRGRDRYAGGTGLGLALVRNVAERSGGSVAVQSKPGAGSTFTVTLPRAH